MADDPEMSESPEPEMAPATAAPGLTAEALAALAELRGAPSETRESPASPTSAPASAPAIAPEAPPLETLSLDHLRLLGQNVQLLMSRNDQQGQLLQDSADRLRETRGELTDTLGLFQTILADLDERIERLGAATAALIRIHQERSQR